MTAVSDPFPSNWPNWEDLQNIWKIKFLSADSQVVKNHIFLFILEFGAFTFGIFRLRNVAQHFGVCITALTLLIAQDLLTNILFRTKIS
jgi:hypothetical protein